MYFHYFKISDFRFQDFRFQISDFKFQVSDFRFRICSFPFGEWCVCVWLMGGGNSQLPTRSPSRRRVSINSPSPFPVRGISRFGFSGLTTLNLRFASFLAMTQSASNSSLLIPNSKLTNYQLHTTNSSFIIPHSTFIILHSAFIILHSSFCIHNSTFYIHHSAFLIHYS